MSDATASAEVPPRWECDLVMKGGVASGIVYPRAVAAIARDYRLRSIGGTSAGAIAAAAAAAMEFGRTSGLNPNARAELDAIPGELGSPVSGGATLLETLFVPDAQAAPLYRRLMEVSRTHSGRPLVRWAAASLWKPFIGGVALAGGLVALLGYAQWPPSWLQLLQLGLILVLGMIVFAAAIVVLRCSRLRAIVEVRSALAAIAENGFGFCSGTGRAVRADGHLSPSLVGWLHATIQRLAGLDLGKPLTFGDLWTAGHRSGHDRKGALDAANKDAGEAEPTRLPRSIDLAFVASDLSRSLCVQLPFMRAEDRLYARKSDLAALLPEDVVKWMDDNQGKNELGEVDLGHVDPAELIRLPPPQDLPILFAMRMSMSFPILLRAVRLYLVRNRPKQKGGAAILEELWLADGGITSNFPVHLFDAPIPTRPTFLLNLVYPDEELEPDDRDVDGQGAQPVLASDHVEAAGISAEADGSTLGRREDELIFMPRTNNSRLQALVRFRHAEPWQRLARFGLRIVSTAREWGDHQLMDAPGYRDRIVHIGMRQHEGGLNLGMSSKALGLLAERGRRAGEVIALRFRPGQTRDPLCKDAPLLLNWSNQRMVRLRSFLAALEVTCGRFTAGWNKDFHLGNLPAEDPQAVRPSLLELIEKLGLKAGETLPQKCGYPFANATQRELAIAVVENLTLLTQELRQDPNVGLDFVNGKSGSPRPKPVLRMRAPDDSDPLRER